MTLVKMTRSEPEVEGGNTTAMIPEEAVSLAAADGWEIADSKKTESAAEAQETREKKEEPEKQEQKKSDSKKPASKKKDADIF